MIWLTRLLALGLIRLLVGAYPRWHAPPDDKGQRIYFANHSSHLDTLAIVAALPTDLRMRTRPVAARDYWGGSALTRFLAVGVLNAVLIDRHRETTEQDPLAPVRNALDAGDSVVIFPEGTRHAGEELAPFKSGLFHLARAYPQAELVPVFLDNLRRAMPKGTKLPVPLGCTVHFGAPISLHSGEERKDFLARAAAAVEALKL